MIPTKISQSFNFNMIYNPYKFKQKVINTNIKHSYSNYYYFSLFDAVRIGDEMFCHSIHQYV